jgi:hypothetical protein
MKQIRAELTMAMANHTMSWLSNQGSNYEEYNDAEFLVNAVENYIKDNTNPVVRNGELLMLKQKPEESVQHFVEKIKENAKLSELEKVKNPANYFPMVCLIAGHDSANTQKKLMLAKVNTFARAIEIFQEEKAAKTSKQFVSGSADVNATSTYKKDQKFTQQAAQNNFWGSSRGTHCRSWGHQRGGRGGHQED